MPIQKQMVVLASSVKHDPGRCIAGREILLGEARHQAGGWVRPVSRVGEGELLPRHFILEDNSAPEFLDIVQFHVDAPDTDRAQPENWLVTDNLSWKRLGQFDPEEIVGLVEHPQNLWLQPDVKTDRATKEYIAANPPLQSLYLLHLNEVEITYFRQKFRLRFNYKTVDYDLAITDPQIQKVSGGDCSALLNNAIACISLAPSFPNRYDGNEYHYKLVATVIRYE